LVGFAGDHVEVRGYVELRTTFADEDAAKTFTDEDVAKTIAISLNDSHEDEAPFS